MKRTPLESLISKKIDGAGDETVTTQLAECSAALDQALLAIDGVLDFTATMTENGGQHQLHLRFHTIRGVEERVARGVFAALFRAEPGGRLLRHKGLAVGSITFCE